MTPWGASKSPHVVERSHISKVTIDSEELSHLINNRPYKCTAKVHIIKLAAN